MPEQIINGTFSSGETGWTFTGNVGVPANETATFNGGNSAPNGEIFQVVNLAANTVGQTATISFNYSEVGSNLSADVRINYQLIGPDGITVIDTATYFQNAGASHNFSFTVTEPGDYTIRFTDISTQTGSRDPRIDNVSLDVPCFVDGTMIETQHGPKAIEDIRAGDKIFTVDNGYVEVAWKRACHVPVSKQCVNSKLAPILIKAGSLGDNLPKSDLLVSRQHRLLLNSPFTSAVFGESSLLIAAAKLLDFPGISVAPIKKDFAYHHILFENHEVIVSNGAATESLFVGPDMERILGRNACEEVFALFPDLLSKPELMPSARQIVQNRRPIRKALSERGTLTGAILQF